MSIIGSIKNHFYQSVLRQRGNPRPKRTITNLNDARHIGVIYDSSEPGNDKAVAAFVAELRERGKTLDIMAYVNDKKVDHIGGITVFNPKTVNWYDVPIDERVNAFCNKPFDLLICAVLGENKTLEYIAYMSKARYRVGPFAEGKTKFYDLMIQMGDKKELGYLLRQMISFLDKIKYD